jgi:hypothetical protein
MRLGACAGTAYASGGLGGGVSLRGYGVRHDDDELSAFTSDPGSQHSQSVDSDLAGSTHLTAAAP